MMIGWGLGTSNSLSVPGILEDARCRGERSGPDEGSPIRTGRPSVFLDDRLLCHVLPGGASVAIVFPYSSTTGRPSAAAAPAGQRAQRSARHILKFRPPHAPPPKSSGRDRAPCPGHHLSLASHGGHTRVISVEGLVGGGLPQ
eukprot:307644-Chlamydomonas_euryale.AAC.1